MKDRLTAEQSNRFIELGVDPSKASMCQIQHSADGETVYRIVEHDEYCYEMSCLHPKPIFTLSDVLTLLPKEIYSEERDIFYKLNITMGNSSSDVYYRHYGYVKGFGPMKSAPELIDCLYELLIWCITNKHIEP